MSNWGFPATAQALQGRALRCIFCGVPQKDAAAITKPGISLTRKFSTIGICCSPIDLTGVVKGMYRY